MGTFRPRKNKEKQRKEISTKKNNYLCIMSNEMEPMQIVIESPRNSADEHSGSSVDNPNRHEVLWETRLEAICTKWKNDCIIRSEKHDTKAKTHKQKFAMFALPSIILPLVMSGVSNLLVDYPLVSSSGMALTAILTGMNTFFNHSKKQTQHFEYSGRFFKLAIDIEKELAKRKKDRTAADVFIERISMDYNNLAFNAPNL
jgi:hypothetical protein